MKLFVTIADKVVNVIASVVLKINQGEPLFEAT